MWKNSTELLDYALRELEKAIEKDEREVKIVVDKFFTSDMDFKESIQKWELKTITEILREEYSNYTIKSTVKNERLSMILTLKTGCTLYYPLVWILTIAKK